MDIEEYKRPAPFENVAPIGQFFIVIGFALISLVLFSFLGVFLATAITHVSMFDLQDTSKINNLNIIRAYKIVQIVSAFGGFIVPAILFAFLASTNIKKYLQVYNPKLLTFILGGLLMLAALPLINWMGEVNSHMQLPASMQGIQDWMKAKEDEAALITDAFTAHQSLRGLLLNLFMIGFLAAAAEELFFRAVLQKIIIESVKNVHIGVWITGIIFSAIHLEFFGFIPRMLMGVYLGYLFVWSKSLWPSIFAHFLNNGTVVFMSYLEDRKMLPQKIEEIGTESSQMGYVVASAVLVALMIFVIYKIEHRKKDMLPAS